MNETRAEIIEHFIKNEFAEGLLLLENCAEKLTEAEKLELKGDELFYRRAFQDAGIIYENAIKKFPDHYISRYQYLMAMQELICENYVNAFKRFQNAIAIDPLFVDAYVELGVMLLGIDDLEGAEQCFRDAARLEPAEIGHLSNLEIVLQKRADTDPRYMDE